MIVDGHTHVWRYPEHLSDEFVYDASHVGGIPGGQQEKINPIMNINLDDHWKAMEPVDKAIVVAFKSNHLKVHVPNEYVAQYVQIHPDKLIGFASVDPHDPDPIAEIEHAVEDLGLKGLKLSPIYQNVPPTDPGLLRIFGKAEKLGLPVLIHQGATFPRRVNLKNALPVLLEDVALQFPDLKMVIAHLGHPWEVDTLVLIRKQPNLYADISALYYRPWQLYNSLILAMEYGVTHKLIFGSDYPFTTPASTIRALYELNNLVEGTRLPKIPKEVLDGIIYRDSLALLNLTVP